MTEALLDIRNLHVNYKIFEGRLNVLNGVNLELGKGEKIGPHHRRPSCSSLPRSRETIRKGHRGESGLRDRGSLGHLPVLWEGD